MVRRSKDRLVDERVEYLAAKRTDMQISVLVTDMRRWEFMRPECKEIKKEGHAESQRSGNSDGREGVRTSLLPLPKPLITGPDSLIGNGDSGPESGPATGSRGPSGRILLELCRNRAFTSISTRCDG